MADTVTSNFLVNGPRYAVLKLTSVSDGTGEAGVVKVDATATGLLGWNVKGQMVYPGVHLALSEIKFSVGGMGVRLQWQASANQDLLIFQASDHWVLGGERLGFAGLSPPSGLAGATGSILLTTIGAAANSSYSLILTLIKNLPNA